MKAMIKIILLSCVLISCSQPPKKDVQQYDVVILGGSVIDGSGSHARKEDVAIRGKNIVKIGNLEDYKAKKTINAQGMVVTPGFINMLSWATDSLVNDGRGLSDVVQGVTLEVFGEGWSMGPLTEKSKLEAQKGINKSPQPYKIEWNTLEQYLEFLQHKGVSPNIASFVGATTVRINAMGEVNRAPTEHELQDMKQQVDQAMRQGAMGVGSALIYAPGFYAKTPELIALSKVAAKYDGMYISHMRSEGNQLTEAVDELIEIAQKANIRAEIYHLKASGKSNWPKMKQVIEKVNDARKDGLKISANMYTYPAGATGLDAAMPPWVQEGGYDAWAKRLQNKAIRAKVIKEMSTPTNEWENLLIAAGAKGVLLPYFRNPKLKKYQGMTLAAVAKAMGETPQETAIDLVIKDGTRVEAIYFLMSEDNIELKIKQPWVSFGSDGEAPDPEVAKKFGSTHPRTYGNFSRVIARYVRDNKDLTLEEAVRKLTSLPASHLKIKKRGLLKEGYFADVLVFDPKKVQDHATFENPHQLSTGMDKVFINGTLVVDKGHHNGALPGMIVRGPGWTGAKNTKL